MIEIKTFLRYSKFFIIYNPLLYFVKLSDRWSKGLELDQASTPTFNRTAVATSDCVGGVRLSHS